MAAGLESSVVNTEKHVSDLQVLYQKAEKVLSIQLNERFKHFA